MDSCERGFSAGKCPYQEINLHAFIRDALLKLLKIKITVCMFLYFCNLIALKQLYKSIVLNKSCILVKKSF